MIHKMILISDGWNYDSKPLPGVEILQKLIIDHTGQGSFVSYISTKENNELKVKRNISFSIEPNQATFILNSLHDFFKENEPIKLDYIKNWECTLIDQDKNEVTYSGAMVGKVNYDSIDLTEYIRTSTKIENCFVFNTMDRTDLGYGCYCAE